MKLILAEPFKTLWSGRDVFAEVEKLQGQVFRELTVRRTLRTEVDGRQYFVKIHRSIGWGEIFKNLITAKLPVLGVGLEWAAIHRLQKLGVPTMTGVAFSEKGSNVTNRYSFIITEELAPAISLENLTVNWVAKPPAFALRYAITAELARIVGKMHRGGVNHRDCYLCHFLLDTTKPMNVRKLKLSVIDLHRAQLRTHLPLRWRNKDLSALYYSALEIGLTQRDKWRFLKGYFRQPLRQILTEQSTSLGLMQRKAYKLYARKLSLGNVP
ncbi:lipopolysaccharide core heptose(I) kinase RfaP [Candidatus Pseudomonas adelgestsugas]|uniref:Lipopolysaccharide core heptose(I) kinase n=1 Tax=Candidatus Pseudomonas adelgestsugas TaxID=1302376 RepID=A0ABX5R7E2_9PSED|nr:lipopolysaccharide core heptose(I) kinase RfaP [Candidatus Pseudomonas adelgestsugas]QAX81564.1 Lipopolysaccharide core heptose(I) kinase RfaP [Candidatus Pseudomonas adelgestsugas]